MNRLGKDFLLDNAFSVSAYSAVCGTMIAALADYYQISLSISSLIAGLPGTLAMVQLLGGWLYQRKQGGYRFLKVTNRIWRTLLPAVFLAVLLPKDAASAVSVLCFAAAVFAFQLCTPAQTEWTVNAVTGHVSEKFYSFRDLSAIAVYTLLYGAANLLMEYAPHEAQQKMAFCLFGLLLAAVLGFSLWIFQRLPQPTETGTAKHTRGYASVLRNRRYRRVLLSYGLWTLASTFVTGFAAVYQVQVLHVSFLQILLWAMIANGVRIACTPAVPVLARRAGWKTVLCLSLAVYMVCGLLWLGIDAENQRYVFPLALIAGALPQVGIAVGFLQFEIDTSPPEDRSLYFATTAAGAGIAGFLGSGVCSLLAEAAGKLGFDVKLIFAVGIAVSLVAIVASATLAPRCETKEEECEHGT